MLKILQIPYFYIIGITIALLTATPSSFALPPETFAPTSKLATGKWAKIEVKESGMQFISNATLKSLGFSNPDKVNVYGFGGRMLPETLHEGMADDLPILPSVKTPAGILFFGHGCFNWEKSSSSTKYQHNNNPYSDKSFYFISDTDPNRASAMERDEEPAAGGAPISTFTERLVHEKDLIAPTNSGRDLHGEDFRTQKRQDFQFSLPDIVGNALAKIRFSALTGNTNSTIKISANGTSLPASNDDIIASRTSDGVLYKSTTTIKEIEEPGEKLTLTIDYSTSGALYMAALDYIEVEYERKLRLNNGDLYFYVNPSTASEVRIENCTESTIIWDVTDPLAPKNVKFSLSGATASFITGAGSHEYAAFNPGKITRNATGAGRIANQDLHGMESPDMVIITPEEYKAEAQKIADLHAATDGLRVAVVTDEAIYNEYSSGTPDLTAFRKLLKMWYDRRTNADGAYARYCLLFARPSYDNKMATPVVKNAGYPRLPIWQSVSTQNTTSKSTSYSTDDYIGMLADQSNKLSMRSAKIHVATGRMPVKSVQEASAAVEKLKKYMTQPTYGSWRNNVMLIADDQDSGKHLNQAEGVYDALRSKGNGADFIYEKLYLDAYKLSYGATGPVYPEAKQRMFDKLTEGVGYVNYIGHGNPRSLSHESLLSWTDVMSMSNKNLPFIFAATCEFMRWDDDDVSAGEELWLNPTAGVIGMICPSREVYIEQNGVFNKNTANFMYEHNADGTPQRVGDVMINGKNTCSDDNKLRYGLIGDPSLRVLSPSLRMSLTGIAGHTPAQDEEMPVVAARSTFEIEGIVCDLNGNVAEDFNGIGEIQLYDAECVVVTNGNGKNGVVSTYNDRRTRLYSGRVKVTDGKWTLTIKMPSEIDNNYSPALLSFYAYDEKGREANGSFTDFYVYGYDENAPEDNDGPEISEFYLNSPAFADGNSVSPSPTVHAKVTDPSGINVSNSGIGHNLIISVDDTMIFNDVNLYFTADENDPLSGSISYPLADIEPGSHTVKLTVWDNANNSSTKELSFFVSALWQPEITRLSTDVNPATTSVNFLISTDGAKGEMGCTVEVYDLSGRRIWSGSAPSLTTSSTTVNVGWDLCDDNGARVARGIYIYRAIVTTPDGSAIVKSNKLAVGSR